LLEVEQFGRFARATRSTQEFVVKLALGWGSPKDALHLFDHTDTAQPLEIIPTLIACRQRLSGIAGAQDKINISNGIGKKLDYA
jgi:hypothetical protein